jgi:hypothetical protein
MRKDRVVGTIEAVLATLPESTTDDPQMPEPVQDFEASCDTSLGC